MSKSTIAAAAVCFSSLVACIPPEPPPARFRPNPPYAPAPVDPYAQSNEITPPPESTPAPKSDPGSVGVGGYPTATRTANPSQVLSPYEPYNVIDVEGFKTGQLARDPSNQKIFRVP